MTVLSGDHFRVKTQMEELHQIESEGSGTPTYLPMELIPLSKGQTPMRLLSIMSVLHSLQLINKLIRVLNYLEI